MKKGIQFHYFFEQSFFLRKSGCSLKKKKRSSLRFYIRFPYFSLKIRVSSKKKRSSLRFISDFLIFLYFPPKIRLFEKGPQSESFSEGKLLLITFTVSTTTFAYFRGAQFGNRWFREHLDFWAKIAE